MNILAILRKAEEKKRNLHRAQLVFAKKSSCPLR